MPKTLHNAVITYPRLVGWYKSYSGAIISDALIQIDPGQYRWACYLESSRQIDPAPLQPEDPRRVDRCGWCRAWMRDHPDA